MSKTKYYRISPTEYLVNNGDRWDVYIMSNEIEARFENATYETKIHKVLNTQLFREFTYRIRGFEFDL